MRPDGVVASDESVKRFYRILQSAYADISSELLTADLSSESKRKAQKAQIEQIIAKADKNIQDWIKVEIPTFYEQGMFDTMSDLNTRGDNVKISQDFAKFHQQAIEAIAQDTWVNASQGMSGLTRSVDRVISAAAKEEIIERLGKGAIKGDSLKKVKEAVAGILESDGLTALIDKNGREWDLLRYAEMLSRTKLTQAQNSGVANRMTESGYDLVIVSNHNGSCPLCAPFEAKVLSITGRNKGYTSVADAEAKGLFHPNCRHVFSPYHEKYLDLAMGWDAQLQKYRPFKDVQRDIIARNKESLGKKLAKIGYAAARGTDHFVDKAKTILVGKGDQQREFVMNSFEAELSERRGLVVDSRTTKTKAGAYYPSDVEIKMNTKYFLEEKDKLTKNHADRTFYHEFGHFIDYEKLDRKPATTASGKSYTLTQQLTRVDSELRSLLNYETSKFIVTERTKLTAQEILKGGTKLQGVKDVEQLTKNLLDGVKMITEDGQGYVQFSRQHRNYLNSTSELFAEAYAIYRMDPEALKAGALKLFEYFEKLVKGL